MPDTDITFCVVTIPGPQGLPGQSGTNGTDGENAYTVTTAAFNMPAELGTETISVANSAIAVVGQVIAIQAGGAFGHFGVVSVPSATTLEVQNLEDSTASSYATNSGAGTSFASGASVNPAGLQGPSGADAIGFAPDSASYIVQTPSGALFGEQALSLLATGILKSTTATGVVSIAADGTDYLSPTTGLQVSLNLLDVANASSARTNLGLTIGLNVQAYNALLAAIAAEAPTVADQIIYTTGVNTVDVTTLSTFIRGLLDDADAATARTTLGISGTSTLPMLLYRQHEDNGTAGGDFTQGGWETVPLNTEVIDTGNNGSISGDEITLLAGTYRYRFGVVGFAVGLMQGRLWNVTDGGVVTPSTPNDSYGSVVIAQLVNAETTAVSEGSGRFILASGKTIRLEAQCETTNPGDGFGDPCSFGVKEVYSWIELEKEA